MYGASSSQVTSLLAAGTPTPTAGATRQQVATASKAAGNVAQLLALRPAT